MKKLSIEDRADLLLKYGVDNPKKWISIHGYQEPIEEIDDWKLEWEKLRLHHLNETTVLFDIIKELTKRILASKNE